MKKNIIRKLVFFVLISLNSCNQNTKRNLGDLQIPQAKKDNTLSEGFNLLEKNCFSCHSPNANEKNKIAPTLAEVKRHYILTSTSKEEFNQDLAEFLNNPSAKNSKVPNAIKSFGLMPKMNLSHNEIKKIASYIYSSNLQDSNWYENNFKEEKRKHNRFKAVNVGPLQKGRQIAMQTKSILGSNLKKAIKSKGTKHAISFCSNEAISLTQSVGPAVNAKVKRVSDKNRNPINQASGTELEYINYLKQALAEKKELKPKLIQTSKKDIGYYPIITNQMCLQCHGKPNKDINSDTYVRIKELYPNDKAINYQSNEIRGLWVVEMNKK